jgi:hypothetical protein
VRSSHTQENTFFYLKDKNEKKVLGRSALNLHWRQKQKTRSTRHTTHNGKTPENDVHLRQLAKKSTHAHLQNIYFLVRFWAYVSPQGERSSSSKTQKKNEYVTEKFAGGDQGGGGIFSGGFFSRGIYFTFFSFDFLLLRWLSASR